MKASRCAASLGIGLAILALGLSPLACNNSLSVVVAKDIQVFHASSVAPTISAFSAGPATRYDFVVPITLEGSADASAWLVNESATKPAQTDPGWLAAKPSSYTLTAVLGSHTIYAWAKSASGLVSDAKTANVTVEEYGVPYVDTFTRTSEAIVYSNSVSFTISSPHAGAGAASITHWTVNESPTAPALGDGAWQTWASLTTPASYAFSDVLGPHTIYAWFKNDQGVVSSAKTISVTYSSIAQPVIASFSNTTPGGVTYDRGIVFTIAATDPGAGASSIAAWQVTESATAPDAQSGTWYAFASPQSGSYTLSAGSFGSRTVYAYVKNDKGVVSNASSFAIPYSDYGAPTIETFSLSTSLPTYSPTIAFNLSTSTYGAGATSIAGWLVNESSVPPAAGAIPDGPTAPSGYTVSASAGSHTVYAWAKNNQGKVSAIKYFTFSITAPTAAWASPYAAGRFVTAHETLLLTCASPVSFPSSGGSASGIGTGKVTASGGSGNWTFAIEPGSDGLGLWTEGAGTLTIGATTTEGIAMTASVSLNVFNGTCVEGTNGLDTNPGTGRLPVKTVQKGIDLADAKYATAVVRVADGTYTSDFSTTGKPVAKLVEGISVYGSYSAVDFSTRTAVSLSVAPTSILEDSSTIVSSAISPYRAVESGTANSATLDGFIVRSCGSSTAFARAVAAIYLESAPTIRNCWVYARSSQYFSYGIYFYKSAPTIDACLIQSAAGYNSVGIFAEATSSVAPVISGNSIAGGAPGAGISSGIHLSTNYINATIKNNYISGGTTTGGLSYGLYNTASSPAVYNNIIVGGKNANCYGFYNVNGSPSLRNNTIKMGDASDGATSACVYIAAGSPSIDNNIIYKASSSTLGYGVYESGASADPASLKNNDFYNFGTSALYYDEGTTETTSIAAVNLMADAGASSNLAADPLFTTSPDAFHLQSGSAIKAAGLNGGAQSPAWGFTADKDGIARTPNDSSTATGWSIGAYETD